MRKWSAAALVFISLTGCSQLQGDGEAVPAVTATPTPSSAAEVRNPLDSYEPSQEQEDTLAKAEDLVAKDCMREYGFTGEIKIPKGALIKAFEQRNRGFILDEKSAERYGYHRYEGTIGGGGDTEPERQGPGTADQQNMIRVLGGTVRHYQGKSVPPGGCMAEAKRRLAKGVVWPKGMKPDVGALEAFVNNLQWDAYKAAEADNRLQQVTKRWRECMRRSGYSYRRPDDAVIDDRWSTAETVSPVEIKTAVADARCQKEVNYVGVYSSLQKAYEERAVDENSEVLRAIKLSVDARLKNAARVISGQPIS